MAGVSFASVNRIQAEAIDVPLAQQESHLKDCLEEETDGIGSQQAPPHFHLPMFFNAILELLDFNFLQVHLHTSTIGWGNFELLLFLVQLLILSHHTDHVC